MIYYFCGEDTYAAREAIDSLAKKEAAKIRWLDKDDITEQGVGQLISQGGGGLFGKEIMVVREPGELLDSTQSELIAALRSAPRGGWYILWDKAEPKKATRVYKEFSKEIRRFGALPMKELINWLMERAKSGGAELDWAAARLLVDRVGIDRWELMSELDKLMLRQKKITEEMVSKTIPVAAQAEIFAVLDAVAQGNKKRAMAGVQVILEEGNSEFYLLSMLAYQLRTLLVIRSAIDQDKRQFDVVREAKMKQYTVQKSWEAAKRRPAIYWREALTRVLATDFVIRQGKVDARTAVLMLTVGLVVG